MKDLSELDWILASIDEKISRHEAKDAIVDGGLCIEALDSVLDVSKRTEFVNDLCDPAELLSFKGKHRFLSVELLKVLEYIYIRS